jgi:hypothetical protein
MYVLTCCARLYIEMSCRWGGGVGLGDVSCTRELYTCRAREEERRVWGEGEVWGGWKCPGGGGEGGRKLDIMCSRFCNSVAPPPPPTHTHISL